MSASARRRAAPTRVAGCAHGRLPRGQPGETGTSARPRTPRPPTTPLARFARRPATSSATSSASTCRASATSRGLRGRAPAVPHRHRHALAGPPRRAHDRARLLRAGARRRPAGSRPRAGADVDVRRGRRLRRAARCSARRASTSSSPASARCAGCPTSAAGPRSSPRCCARAGGCSSARATRCCGRSTTRGRTACSRRATRTSSAPSRLVCDEAGTYVETDVEFTHNVTHEWNHGLGEIVTALLDAGPAADRRSSSTTACRGTRCPGRWSRSTAASGGSRDRPWRLPHSYTLQAVRL